MTKPNYNKNQTRHIEHVRNYTLKAIHQYKMIEDGDKVLVAVSGGKDSLVLLDALSSIQKYGMLSFELEALHINVTDVPYAVDKEYLNEFALNLNVPIHYIDIEARIEDRGKKAPCFVCSWHRRKALFTFAKANGFKKLALGHHMDDAVETLVINMAYHANISSLPGKLNMFDGELHLIRPLIQLSDSDTQTFAKIRQYKPLISSCPHEDLTRRTTARNLIKSMQVLHPKAKTNLFNSMANIDLDYLA
jgi:tRNA(Ile)-lysidine synthase TilS/MesJ